MLVPAVVLSPLSKFQYLFRPPLKLQRFFFLSFLSLFSVSIQTSSEVILWVDHSVHRQLFCFSHDNCLLSDFPSSTVSQIGRNWNYLYIRENSLSFYGEQTIYHRPITKTKLLKRRVVVVNRGSLPGRDEHECGIWFSERPCNVRKIRGALSF